MIKRIAQRGFSISTAIVATLLLAGGFFVGQWTSHDRSLAPPAITLQATTAQNNDVFAVASGAIDQGNEGVFFLDFLTGDLECRIISERNAKLIGVFKRNVINDVGANKKKKARYLLATSQVSFLRGANNARPGQTVIWVIDANTTKYVAYGMTWNRTSASQLQPQQGTFTVLDAGQIRQLNLPGAG